MSSVSTALHRNCHTTLCLATMDKMPSVSQVRIGSYSVRGFYCSNGADITDNLLHFINNTNINLCHKRLRRFSLVLLLFLFLFLNINHRRRSPYLLHKQQ